MGKSGPVKVYSLTMAFQHGSGKLENQGYDYLLPINSNLVPQKKPKVNITYEIRYLLTIPKILKFVLSIPSLPDCRLSS